MFVLKKIIALVLSLVMLMTVCIPAVAAEDGKCDCGETPMIYVGPLGNTDIYANFGTEDEKILFRPDTKTILGIVAKVLPGVLLTVLTRNYDYLGDALISSVYDAMGEMALDENGNSYPHVTVDLELPTDPAHGIGRDYYFSYDWRLDPIEIARQLKDFIAHVKELTGHDTVILKASSMGGVQMMAYFNEYGYDGIETAIFQCCPILGTSFAGDLLCKKVALDGKALLDFGVGAYQPVDAESTLLYFLFNTLYYSGLIDIVMPIGERVIDNLLDRAYDELLTPVFGTLLGLWAFVPDCNYETAKAMQLDPETQAGLIAKADYYHYNVQCRAEEILNGAVDCGVKVMIVAGYNIMGTPLIESMYNDSDCTVDTMYASAGGTVAKMHETLGEDYKQADCSCGHNHLSPDGKIDASTCILPENTWFIKDMLHSNGQPGIDGLYNWFAYSDEYYNVWSNPLYPQFLQNDEPNERVIAMGNFAEGVEPPTYEEGDSFHDFYVKYGAPVVDPTLATLDKIRAFFGK